MTSVDILQLRRRRTGLGIHIVKITEFESALRAPNCSPPNYLNKYNAVGTREHLSIPATQVFWMITEPPTERMAPEPQTTRRRTSIHSAHPCSVTQNKHQAKGRDEQIMGLKTRRPMLQCEVQATDLANVGRKTACVIIENSQNNAPYFYRACYSSQYNVTYL